MSRTRAATMIVTAVACLAGGDARSEGPGVPKEKSKGAARGPTAEEFAALKQRVDEQQALLMRMTQQQNEILLRLLPRTERQGTGGTVGRVFPPQSPPPPEDEALPAARPKLATITGRVEVKGKPWGPIYVYVENVKEPLVDRNVEIVQKDRAFVPNVLVVQKGTRVAFPNADPFLHNVFSPSTTHPFDLGSYRQGDKAGAVRLFNPGVVEVLCNMHAKMRANVLVVPNRHHVKVSGDGSFRLESVPVGSRQLVAWTPDARPVTESVTLTPAGANVTFALQVRTAPPPRDKIGNPRASGYSQEE